jgi:hypothetical protein
MSTKVKELKTAILVAFVSQIRGKSGEVFSIKKSH